MTSRDVSRTRASQAIDNLSLAFDVEADLIPGPPLLLDEVPSSTTLQPRTWRSASPAWIIPVNALVYLASAFYAPFMSQTLIDIICASRSVASLDTECARDPALQATTARLVLVMEVIGGVLAAGTIGFWAERCNRWGRMRVASLSIAGIVCNLAVVTLISRYPRYPWLILLGSVFSGVSGGSSGFNLAVTTYLSDTTPDGSRARVFATLQGLIVIGIAVGPILGSTLASVTGNPLAPFFAAMVMMGVCLLIIAFVVPESLTAEAKIAHLQKVQEDRKLHAERMEAEMDWNGRKRAFWRPLLGFLGPLAIFRPYERQDGTWNYSLAFMAATDCFSVMAMGSAIYKFQFALYSYGWQGEDIGPYMALINGARAVVLLAILPACLRIAKRWKSGASVDLWGTRISYLFYILAYTLLAIHPTARQFVIYTLILTLGFGDQACAGSLALSLLPPGAEKSHLFAALSLVEIFGVSLVSPALFGLVYSTTVATYAPTMFAVSAGCIVLAQLCLAGVRVP